MPRNDERRYTNRCACGWTVEGSLDEVVDATIDHGRRIHNMAAAREEVVAALAPPQVDAPDGADAAEAAGPADA